MARFASLVVLASLAMGCRPALTDAYFRCTDGRCPSGLSCWSDGFCHTTAETDGGLSSDTPIAPDASERPDVRGDGGSPLSCPCPGAATCIADSYCAGPCMDGVCPTSALCSSGHCLAGCDPGDVCPGSSTCILGEWTAGDPFAGACMDATDAFPATHGQTCGTCDPPDSCVGGRCMRRCETERSDCGAGETCVPGPPGAGGALVCVTQNCDVGVTCPTGTACTIAPEGPTLCLPAGWM